MWHFCGVAGIGTSSPVQGMGVYAMCHFFMETNDSVFDYGSAFWFSPSNPPCLALALPLPFLQFWIVLLPSFCVLIYAPQAFLRWRYVLGLPSTQTCLSLCTRFD